MPSAFEHGPAITVPASNTTAKAAVIWSAASNLGESTIILDSGGNGRIGIAGDLDVITITSGTVTVSGTVAATTLTGAGAGITALAAANITANGTLPALNGAALTALTAANITTSGTLPALNGAALTALNADNIGSGTVPVARLGDGNESNSTFLRGDNTWAAATTTKVALTAYPSATISNVTGSGEPGYDIVWNTEINDVGNDFNTSNGVFTAPRTGMYLVATSMRLHGITSSHNRSLIYMKVAGTSALNNVADCGDPHSFMSNGSHVSISSTAMVYMTATDTLTINVHVFGSSDDIDIAGGSYPVSWVSIAEL